LTPDELDCKFIQLNKNVYQKNFPPFTNEIIGKHPLQFNISIFDFENFDENSMTFHTKLVLKMKWFDDRIIFKNLKYDNESINTVSIYLHLFWLLQFQVGFLGIFHKNNLV